MIGYKVSQLAKKRQDIVQGPIAQKSEIQYKIMDYSQSWR